MKKPLNENLVKCGDKVYAKTLVFGNWKAKSVFKNRKAYDRNKNKSSSWD